MGRLPWSAATLFAPGGIAHVLRRDPGRSRLWLRASEVRAVRFPSQSGAEANPREASDTRPIIRYTRAELPGNTPFPFGALAHPLPCVFTAKLFHEAPKRLSRVPWNFGVGPCDLRPHSWFQLADGALTQLREIATRLPYHGSIFFSPDGASGHARAIQPPNGLPPRSRPDKLSLGLARGG